jgi:metal-sulfur cluster biosynthetic enzyme
MATPSSQQVLEALGRIKDPDLGRDVVSLGMIKELDISPHDRQRAAGLSPAQAL